MAGLLLAAGAGRRYGMPKALVDTGSGPWARSALATMAGLGPLLVVVGSHADEVRAVLPPATPVVVNPEHVTGMGGSLRTGLAVLAADARVRAVVVMLVDLPDVTAEVIARIVIRVGKHPERVLARAVYHGEPGHPVLLGRDHFAAVMAEAIADQGARTYLREHEVELVECGDLAGGRDVDAPGG